MTSATLDVVSAALDQAENVRAGERLPREVARLPARTPDERCSFVLGDAGASNVGIKIFLGP